MAKSVSLYISNLCRICIKLAFISLILFIIWSIYLIFTKDPMVLALGWIAGMFLVPFFFVVIVASLLLYVINPPKKQENKTSDLYNPLEKSLLKNKKLSRYLIAISICLSITYIILHDISIMYIQMILCFFTLFLAFKYGKQILFTGITLFLSQIKIIQLLFWGKLSEGLTISLSEYMYTYIGGFTPLITFLSILFLVFSNWIIYRKSNKL